jgi:hypothetical protein
MVATLTANNNKGEKMAIPVDDLLPILKAAYEVLQESPGRQGHVSDIAEAAVLRNKNMGMSKDDFAAKLTASLAAHVKREGALFARVVGKKGENGKPASYKKGMYRLRQVRTVRPEPAPPVQVDTSYLGKAGEMAVMSELLFWGFNPSLMTVDNGIDIVASKNNTYYHLQVKTSSPRADGKFGFTIRTAAFDANHSNSTFYVFVMRDGSSNTFVVIPSSHLLLLRKHGTIKNSETSLSIIIAVEDKGKTFKLNGKENVGLFVNGFGLIC